MSVYIKGLEMPTSCGFCPFENHTDDGYECRINGCLTEYQQRPSDCPLVPAADVVPVRHAYWRHYDTTMGGTKLYVCSLCDGDSKTENEIKRCLYCPNCGALMDKAVPFLLWAKT